MSNSTKEVIEAVQSNVDRVVQAVKEMGPQAQWASEEVLAVVSIEGIASLSVTVAVIIFSICLFRIGWKAGVKQDWADGAYWAFLIGSGIIGVAMLAALGKHMGQWLAKILHPAGYLIKQILIQ